MAKDKTTWEIRMPKFSQLKSDLDVDVLIIGGGITGIICAYLLSKEKLKVALIEKNRLCSGATVATTAFLTRIIDTDLRKLVKMYGYSQTEDLIKAHQYAIDQFENIIKKNKIDCEFMRCPNYSYAIDEKSAMDLIEENRIARSFGIKTEFSRSLELGFDNYGYIKIENQAKFHPLKFLSSLAKIAKDNGVMIFENTEAKEIQDKYKIITNRGEISARKIIIATYAPFDNKIYFKKAFYDSYIIEAKIPKGMIPEGIYEDTMDPYHYFRIDPQGKHDRMIIGGEDHRSDIPVSDSKSFKGLKEYINNTFPGMKYKIARKWKGPILETVDGLGYVGPVDNKEIYYATGFSGNGMTYSMLASKIIVNDVLNEKDKQLIRYAQIYNANRKPNLTSLAHKGVDYSRELIHGAVKNTLKT